MKRKLADLHLHSSASDGKYTPENVIRYAAESHLQAVSLTDHDTISGLAAARKAAEDYGIEFINGVELTTFFQGKDCHILGYGFNETDKAIQKIFSQQFSSRNNRAEAMIGRLNKLGFEINFEEVWAESNNAPVSRVHIARVMMSKGYCGTQHEVFLRYLGDDAPAYVPFHFIDAAEGIQAIHQAGGVAILAHPSTHYIYEDLKKLMDIGIDGFEYIHPSHNYNSQLKYRNHARNHELIVTGGSDFHGYLNKDFLNLGMVAIDMEHVRTLREYTYTKTSNAQLT